MIRGKILLKNPISPRNRIFKSTNHLGCLYTSVKNLESFQNLQGLANSGSYCKINVVIKNISKWAFGAQLDKNVVSTCYIYKLLMMPPLPATQYSSGCQSFFMPPRGRKREARER